MLARLTTPFITSLTLLMLECVLLSLNCMLSSSLSILGRIAALAFCLIFCICKAILLGVLVAPGVVLTSSGISELILGLIEVLVSRDPSPGALMFSGVLSLLLLRLSSSVSMVLLVSLLVLLELGEGVTAMVAEKKSVSVRCLAPVDTDGSCEGLGEGKADGSEGMVCHNHCHCIEYVLQ